MFCRFGHKPRDLVCEVLFLKKQHCIFLIINLCYICICISLAEARYGLCGRVQYFIEKRLLTLFLDTQKLRNFLISVRNVATVDALWCVYAYRCHQLSLG